MYDQIETVDDLPAGWTDQQDGGTYRLKKRGDAALFGYAVGPHSWKKFLFPPRQRIFSARRTETGFEIKPETEDTPKYAFIGVRSCELHAIAIQDKVFMGQFTDPIYQARREKAFIVAVNCGQAGGTCFCVSMNTGPKAQGWLRSRANRALGKRPPRFPCGDRDGTRNRGHGTCSRV